MTETVRLCLENELKGLHCINIKIERKTNENQHNMIASVRYIERDLMVLVFQKMIIQRSRYKKNGIINFIETIDEQADLKLFAD